MVNYIRDQVRKGVKRPQVESKSTIEDEFLLMPVMEDDTVLYNLEEILQSVSQSATNEVDELREQLESLQSQFAAYREDVQKQLKLDVDDAPGTAEKVAATLKKQGTPRSDIDDHYFSSYSYNAIHESMLKDKVRTDAYRDFIYDNKDVFKDKVVLDVGCGTGILSMFCARAGAKQVIAVDNSAIIEKAQQIIKDNDLEDKIVCVRGKIEQVSLPVEKVDIIVSEWMGYCLLFESMLDSVIFARDKYLAPDGLMVPSHINIEVAPLADSDLRISYIDFWQDVYGFDMRKMLEKAHEEALIRLVEGKELCADSATVLRLDLHTTKVSDLSFSSPACFKVKDGFEVLEGFVSWFDTFFLPSRSTELPASMTVAQAKKKGWVAFSTGPTPEVPTHWQQGVCLITEPENKLSADQEVNTQVTFRKKEDSHRSLEIEISWGLGSRTDKSQRWSLD